MTSTTHYFRVLTAAALLSSTAMLAGCGSSEKVTRTTTTETTAPAPVPTESSTTTTTHESQ